jgi:hypothetical protein
MSKTTETASPIRRELPWQFVAGIILADVSVMLIGLAGWDALNFETRTVIYVSGSMLLGGGLYLIVSDTIRFTELWSRPSLSSKGIYLGSFKLNGFLIEAYERETSDGRKEFRLTTFPAVVTAQEAALVRYIVIEGLVENLWPQLSKRIHEETDWAFVS